MAVPSLFHFGLAERPRGPGPWTSRLLRAAPIGLLAGLLLFGCSREEESSSDPVVAAGPSIEIVLREGARLDLALPERVRIWSETSREILFEGPIFPTLEAGPGGVVGVRVAEDGDGVILGGRRFEPPLEVYGLQGDDPGPEPAAGRGAFLGIPAAGAGAVRDRGATPGAPKDALRFRGHFILEARDGMLCLKNKLSLEEYLAGVVGAEVPASVFPLEALKAQAVAARTYALFSILEAERRGQRPAFAGTETFQVYGGLAWEHPRVLEAVDATAGEVLTHQGALFRAYFHSTCGGRTADAGSVFDEPEIEPLRGVVCGHCEHPEHSRWEIAWTAARIGEALLPWLASRGVEVGAIEDVQVAERDPGGRVRYLSVRHSRGSFEIHAVRFRALSRALGGWGLKSTWFDVFRRGEELVFKGAGWGHGVGLCQVGAGKLGQTESCAEILAHYYPGSEITRAY